MAVLMVLVVLMLMVVRVWGILFAHSEQSKTTGDHRSTRTGRHPRSCTLVCLVLRFNGIRSIATGKLSVSGGRYPGCIEAQGSSSANPQTSHYISIIRRLLWGITQIYR